MKIQLQSILTCPNCGHSKEETMPVDSCQYFYECTNCKTILKPKQGDCCVFCSYGSVACPPKNKAQLVTMFFMVLTTTFVVAFPTVLIVMPSIRKFVASIIEE